MKKTSRALSKWIVVLLCGIISILYFAGFRITYAPNLENSWDAISACAGWCGAIMSAIAIFVAIDIPKKIAEQQNNISLFEKRYSAFNTLAFLLSVVKPIIEGELEDKNHCFYLDNMVETFDSISITREGISGCKDPASVYVRLIFEAGKIKYLFELKEFDVVIDFLYAFDQYLTDVHKVESADETALKTIYTKLQNDKIIDKLEAQLKI